MMVLGSCLLGMVLFVYNDMKQDNDRFSSDITSIRTTMQEVNLGINTLNTQMRVFDSVTQEMRASVKENQAKLAELSAQIAEIKYAMKLLENKSN